MWEQNLVWVVQGMKYYLAMWDLEQAIINKDPYEPTSFW